MFTVEKIKKIFDNIKVEEFHINLKEKSIWFHEKEGQRDRDKMLVCSLSGDIRWHKGFYSLFMQRVIEGINRKSYFGKSNQTIEIKQHRWGLDVIDHSLAEPKNVLDSFRFEVKEVGSYKTDQAREQAIKYILDQMG